MVAVAPYSMEDLNINLVRKVRIFTAWDSVQAKVSAAPWGTEGAIGGAVASEGLGLLVRSLAMLALRI
jgi:hypothetical protein